MRERDRRDRDVGAMRFERLQDRRQLEASPFCARREVLHDDAVGHIDKRHPLRQRRARCAAGQRCFGQHRFQPRQSDRGA
jgi:hypothetical protein